MVRIICALQVGNPKLRVSLSLKPGQKKKSLIFHLPRGLTPQVPSTSVGKFLQTKEKG